MAFKSLVLDIDGVLLRDKSLLNHVKHNCERYVKAKLPECKDPILVNRLLYTNCGHTARGLQSLFGIDASDFNEKVYDVPLRARLWEVLSSSEFQKEAESIHEHTKNGWRVTLFTNSPIEWAGQVAHAISDEVYVVCPGSDVSVSPLKPEATAYSNFAKHHTHVFVDDSLQNLSTARWLPNWHPVYFNDSKFSKTVYKPKWCPTIGSIWELDIFLNSMSLQAENHETYI
jgi:hypothetical protein